MLFVMLMLVKVNGIAQSVKCSVEKDIDTDIGTVRPSKTDERRGVKTSPAQDVLSPVKVVSWSLTEVLLPPLCTVG